MKRFIKTSIILFLLALLVVVVIFLYIQVNLQTTPTDREAASRQPPVVSVVPATTTQALEEPASQSSPEEAESAGIPLRNLALTDTQRSLAAGAGIDVETFVITPAMITCAEERLGATRVAEIVAGASPGVLETATLLRCLGAD
jgi:hypothetical protein